MKKLLFPLLLIGVVLLFTRTSCNDKDYDLCDAPQPLIERSFTLSINVKYKDHVPYVGNIRFMINKMYCYGNQSGLYSTQGITDLTGFWRPGSVYTYKFKDLKDFVEMVFTVQKEGTQLLETKEDTFYYSDVEGKPGGIEITYQMILPWTSEE